MSSDNEQVDVQEPQKAPVAQVGNTAPEAETGDVAPAAQEEGAVPEADVEQKPAKKPLTREERAARRKRRRLKREAGRGRKLAATKDLHQIGMSDEVVIRFDHVTKSYDLYKNDWGRFLGAFNIKGRNYEGAVKANEDLSFEIYKGEAVAFLGLNGAGKSTALKMITGVTHPTQGTVEVNGRVSALLELSAGFDAKLTGRENIRLRGQIMGLTDEEMAEIEPRAVEFADLGMYIDQPIRSYSSGMRSRLGFALAVSVEPEILVIDEALSVGDRRFKRRCIRRIREIMMNSEVTVLFVTHSSTMAQQFCSRGIVLEKGKKIFDGTMDDAMEFYESIA